jgi:adenylate kinase family enzyme
MLTKSLLSYMADCERLIVQASSAVNSFFISESDIPDGKPLFTGFLRDSLVCHHKFLMTTGGGSVAGNLYRLEPNLNYLRPEKRMGIKQLLDNRDLARNYIMDIVDESSFASSNSFLGLSPLTYAVYANLANRATNDTSNAQHRASVFNIINLYCFLQGKWPSYENVDAAHPFIAYKVQGAVISLMQDAEKAKKVLALADERLFPQVFAVEPDKDSFADFKARLEVVSRALAVYGAARMEGAIDRAHDEYRENSVHYLWEQYGHVAKGNAISSRPLLYDPAGVCFALQILLLSFRKPEGGYNLQAFLGKYSNLVTHSVEHVLESLSEAGSFPYGAPFSYKPNGTVGFTTSINGLSAFNHFILKLIWNARKADYPSRKFFEALLLDHQEHFEKLFSLSSVFLSTVQTFKIKRDACDFLNAERTLMGWSTDRGFNRDRIESWVTIEVLRFAVYMREVLQEYLQLFVAGKYRAILPVGQPAWPYEGSNPVKGIDTSQFKNEKLLIDADGEHLLATKDPLDLDAINVENAPIPFLHSKFSKFMGAKLVTEDWDQEVSSVLLFGPPGTAKSTIVQSLAQKLHWHFLEISPSEFIIDGLEKIEQNAKGLFQDLSALRETVILFDELDSLFVDRDFLAAESIINLIVPAMLPKLQSLSKRAKNQRLLIVVATNFYDRLDQAMVRLGRIDKHLLVLPYNDISRYEVLKSLLERPEELTDDAITLYQSSSKLYVFEEIQSISRSMNRSASGPITYIPSSIEPSWYSSRIPRTPEDRRKRVRGTKRLAFEVAEVVNRLLGKKRTLTANDEWVNIKRVFDANSSDLSRLNLKDWKTLCNDIESALDSQSDG